MKMQTAFNSLISIRFAIVATVAIFLSAIGGCTAAPDPPDRQSPAEQAPTAPAFASILEKYTDDVVALGAPSVHIQMNSQLGEWSKAVGVRSLENQEPAQLTDQVHIGDVTMSMVAVSVLKLVDEGKVRLDDPITQYLPELGDLINAPGAVSVRSLLSHRSGMPSYWEVLLKSTPMRDVLAKRMSYEERLAVAATVPWGTRADTPAGEPVSEFSYSNSNYAVLGLLVERLRGRGIGDILARDVAEPLGLQATLMSREESAPEKMAHGYVLLGGERVDTTLPAHDIGNADSGVISTVADLNTFTAGLVQGKLLKAETVKEMHSSTYEGYGLGLTLFDDACSDSNYLGHVGDVPGYGTVALTSADGSRQVAIAVALPPGSPREEFDPRVNQMVNVALEALNMAC
ncbi:serine hydrolase domain-containing protein [Arthrobacter pascens]|uniref:serine hydrolase domain-containing protein n=1 Tax=Arthrobacter pascens TaxID=1677 RepID=UPI00196AA7D3|nr:serine hydrolase domain-containing protein [Arthrobacter pascens]MBN3497860.1 beta-lactamase family protein [Arthrobacter pascens]